MCAFLSGENLVASSLDIFLFPVSVRLFIVQLSKVLSTGRTEDTLFPLLLKTCLAQRHGSCQTVASVVK